MCFLKHFISGLYALPKIFLCIRVLQICFGSVYLNRRVFVIIRAKTIFNNRSTNKNYLHQENRLGMTNCKTLLRGGGTGLKLILLTRNLAFSSGAAPVRYDHFCVAQNICKDKVS